MDMSNIPNHIAIIPDGNRRWARLHGVPTIEGHREGVNRAIEILETLYEHGIPFFTFWGSSLSNLTTRTKEEIFALEQLYALQFKKLVENRQIHKKRVKIRVLGPWESVLGKKAVSSIRKAEKKTEHYGDFSLTFLIAYDGIKEMIRAMEQIASEARESRDLVINSELLKKHLYTRELPPVDLVIRTGGEPHLSAGFMMWDIAESQLEFSEKLWPDYTKDDFAAAISKFQKRERRFGT
jgi:undecaprenyl diphosphate synthase